MPNHGIDVNGANCEGLQRALREERVLTRVELAHIDECDACMDAWLTLALDAKPEVVIPAEFAVRVREELPVREAKRTAVGTPRSWGVISAMAVALVILVVCFLGPKPANSWVGGAFVMLVASEIAGLALWLGPRWLGR